MFSHKLNQITIDPSINSQVGTLPINTAWDSDDPIVLDFKNEIKEKMFSNQDNKCAYCELSLDTRKTEIEHIAPKYKYPSEKFNTQNLVLACSKCNGPECKGKRITVSNNTGNYNQWSFNIMHPYFDDPTDFYDYHESLDSSFFISVKKGISSQMSSKADNTINMFHLNDEPMLNERWNMFLGKLFPRIKDISEYKEE